MSITWLYRNKEFTSEDIREDDKAYVYLITNLRSGKMYVGQKCFRFRRFAQKNKKKKRILVESDWGNYWGSCRELLAEIAAIGQQNFRREILHLCRSKGEANYLELKEQMDRGVLLRPDEYYNSFVGRRIARAHVKELMP